MTETPDQPALDDGDENPDDLVGDETAPDHDLDPATFDEDTDEDGEQ